jgi:putative transposase
MSRRARVAPGGIVYHALNRAAARLPLFHKPQDYDAFERVMVEAMVARPTRLLAYCLMPNHWHLVLWPVEDGELSAFVGWLSHTHAMRYRTHYHDGGVGHLYQQRYKSFPVQDDAHFLNVARYVERNALRANLVERAEDWRWGSLWRRTRAHGEANPLLHRWPVDEPSDWLSWVNEPQTEAELDALRRSARRGSPYGEESWQRQMAERLGLGHTLRPLGRPRKRPPPSESQGEQTPVDP